MSKQLEQTSRKSLRYRGNECLNCGHPLEISDRYCSYCGQLNSTKKLSLQDYFGEFIISIVNYDSRFRYTVKDLLFKPGVITRNFTSGKRMRYANPFRFFLSVSIIYFLLSGFLDFIQIADAESEENPSLQNIFNFQDDDDQAEIPLDSINYYKILALNTKDKDSLEQLPLIYRRESSLDTLNFVSRTAFKLKMFHIFSLQTKVENSYQALDSLEYSKSKLNVWLYDREKGLKRIQENPVAFGQYLAKKIPVFLFFLAPLFACFFLLLYYNSESVRFHKNKLRVTSRKKLQSLFKTPYIGGFCLYCLATLRSVFVVKRNYNYMEHVIFIFHIFTFLFLVLLLLLVPEFLMGSSLLSGLFISFVAPFYFYKALRNFYQESRLRTLMKFFILNIVFLMLGILTGSVFFFLTAALY
ncbi:MAG TPA: hypothetical protein DIV44_14565 [Leeuwenhoekiella sp.]|uniref:DUF3667 domain-containing protein n=1 Tax=Leeuwenhoekiella palythoae TaxID=573501 RepID=UPI000C4208B0|nr:DUF3667 domain-containing protein [Leeuwenhoekiella palythoae]MBH13609.1 hypothetical protein [Leeuwenhoekiella sp.]UBZ09579.1 DUF3667 domain-containing protein [Leeuwenhoekiella palythoae]HBO29065.1 hypothetical protein [Leeuwenhoekiella sp.]HCQ78028.1 hypothetical protein [Leeuwenhoekiella sp.]